MNNLLVTCASHPHKCSFLWLLAHQTWSTNPWSIDTEADELHKAEEATMLGLLYNMQLLFQKSFAILEAQPFFFFWNSVDPIVAAGRTTAQLDAFYFLVTFKTSEFLIVFVT